MPKNRISRKKDSTGRYSYQITDATGKRHSLKSRKNESFADFQNRCDKLDQEVERIAQSGRRTEDFDSLFQLWHESYVVPNLSNSEIANTKHLYERHVKSWIARKRISEITRADVYKVLSKAQKRGLSAATIKLIRGCISRPYNWAINSLGYRLVPPTQGLVFRMDSAKQEKKTKVMSEEDLDRFLKAAERSRYYNYFRLLAYTGLRPSEALGLQVGDITATEIKVRRSITVHDDEFSGLKSAAAYREIPITPGIREVLQDQMSKVAFASRERWLFPSANGTAPKMESIKSAFRRIRKQTAEWKIGGKTNNKKLKVLRPAVDCSLYSFRHTFATRMAEAGMNQKALQEIMGHSDIKITLQYYIGLTDRMLEDAKEKMSLMSKDTCIQSRIQKDENDAQSEAK